jgi:hypothetical protein
LVGQHQQHLLLRELHCNKQNDENHEMFFTYHFESVTKLSSGEINLFNFNETALKHSLSPKNNCEFKAVHRGDGGDMSPTAAHKQRNQKAWCSKLGRRELFFFNHHSLHILLSAHPSSSAFRIPHLSLPLDLKKKMEPKH